MLYIYIILFLEDKDRLNVSCKTYELEDNPFEIAFLGRTITNEENGHF